MSGSRWVITSWLSGSWRSFLYSSSVYSCHVFLISSASVRYIPFLFFTVPVFAWNVPLVSLILLKRSLVFPILLFSSISLHWSLRKAFLSLLAILWKSAFKWVYLLFSPLPLASLLFTAICKASSDNHFAFLQFSFWGWSLSLSPVQRHESPSTVLQVLWSVHLSNSKRICCTAGASGDIGSNPGSGRSPGEGHGNLLQYSFLENPPTEEPGGLQSLGSQRVRHNWSDLASMHACAC